MIKPFYADCIKSDKRVSTTFSFIHFFFPKILAHIGELGIVGFVLSLPFFSPLGYVIPILEDCGTENLLGGKITYQGA